jgi:hypothetical protein
VPDDSPVAPFDDWVTDFVWLAAQGGDAIMVAPALGHTRGRHSTGKQLLHPCYEGSTFIALGLTAAQPQVEQNLDPPPAVNRRDDASGRRTSGGAKYLISEQI